MYDISQAKLNETRGVVYYTDCAYDSFGICSSLDLYGGNMTVGNDFVPNDSTTLDESAAAPSETHAAVCYSQEGEGHCEEGRRQVC